MVGVSVVVVVDSVVVVVDSVVVAVDSVVVVVDSVVVVVDSEVVSVVVVAGTVLQSSPKHHFLMGIAVLVALARFSKNTIVCSTEPSGATSPREVIMEPDDSGCWLTKNSTSSSTFPISLGTAVVVLVVVLDAKI